MAHDPRRVLVTYHTNSRNPRARKWYYVAVACDTPDGLLAGYRARALELGAGGNSRDIATRAARAYAEAHGLPWLKGVWRGDLGQLAGAGDATVYVREA